VAARGLNGGRDLTVKSLATPTPPSFATRTSTRPIPRPDPPSASTACGLGQRARSERDDLGYLLNPGPAVAADEMAVGMTSDRYPSVAVFELSQRGSAPANKSAYERDYLGLGPNIVNPLTLNIPSSQGIRIVQICGRQLFRHGVVSNDKDEHVGGR
jgi:hypothetical protein